MATVDTAIDCCKMMNSVVVHYMECCRSSVENLEVTFNIEMESKIVQTEFQIKSVVSVQSPVFTPTIA